MKLLRKSIEMIAVFSLEGNASPIRFRYTNSNNEILIITIDKVLSKTMDRFAGNKMFKYTCESCIKGEQKPFELRFEVDTCKWFLYKV